MPGKIPQLISAIQAGNIQSLARAITIVENELEDSEELLKNLPNTKASKLVGITGPPGAGKSSLVNALLHYWTQQKMKIAVLAVDPSSPFNFGALLGDRIRMSTFYNHPDVFIRSLASRGALGGLSKKMMEVADVLKAAPFDLIVVETVGVGQSEVEIAGLADCTVVALVPEAGDEVQTIKAGIMEIADIFVVNKSDRDQADSLYKELCKLVHEKAGKKLEIPVIKTVATENTGIEKLAEAIKTCLSAELSSERKLLLLAEKCWQIIIARRMKGISRNEILALLREHVNDPKFNLYNFVERFS